MSDLAGRIAELSPEKLKLLRQRSKKPKVDRSLPRIVPAPQERYEPFPLTDIQQAYWIGRQEGMELGNVSAHSYMEFEGDDIDVERFEEAWRRLVDRHDMLRMVILADGRQQVLPEVPPYEIRTVDLSASEPDAAAEALAAVRDEMSHEVLPADRWPLFDIRASLLPGGRVRIHFSFDIMIADLWSFKLLFADLSRFYHDPRIVLPAPELSFRDYVLAERGLRETELYERSQRYWRDRLPELPLAPELPIVQDSQALASPRFSRRRKRLEKEEWSELKQHARQHGLTPSTVLLTAYAQVLATWSKSSRFTLNLTLFNRLPMHPQVNEIVGDFTALNLLAFHLSDGGSFVTRAKRVQEQMGRDLQHGLTSGVGLLRDLAWMRGRQGAMMPVVFTSTLGQPDLGEEDRSGLAAAELVYSISQTPQVWLDHQVSEDSGALVFNWDTVDDLFPESLMDTMFEAYCHLLDRLRDDDEVWTRPPAELLPPGMRRRREAVNATEAPLPEGLLSTPFEDQVRKGPERPAVVAGERRLSYGELDERSASLARELVARGATRNQLVAVVAEKGWEQVVGVLAVLRAGAAYLPLDPRLPEERLHYLLENGEVEVALTNQEAAREVSWPAAVETLVIDVERATGAAPAVDVRPQDLAYVIFTSGSTGLPKGVMIEHRSALNTIVDINQRFDVTDRDRVLSLSALSFDLSVYDIFGLLAAGGAVVLPEDGTGREPARWLELIERESVTVWNTVPALLEMLVTFAEDRGVRFPPSLRLVLLSGDWVPVKLAGRLRALCNQEVEVVSLGGATEGSIWSIHYPIEEVDPSWRSIPYGRPLANQRFHVLHGDLQPCPDWVPGDLYIGGVGLAQGYWRDEERTLAAFVEHPQTGERLYRTGDLGRYLPDGNIEFLGREDFQVKVQGYRVELGEIEAALSQHPAVKDVVVTARGETHGSKQLVAYVVCKSGQTTTAETLADFSATKIPAYMVPGAFVFLDSLPLSATGKVDRKALPEVRAEQESEAGVDSALLERVREMVGSVLKVEQPDPDAALFELGATSVEMVRIANLLETELGFRPRMDELVGLSNVRAVARFYEEGMAPSEPAAAAVEPAEPPSVWTSYDLILDPAERDAFKEHRKGVRADLADRKRLELGDRPLDEPWFRRLMERRSHRRFTVEPVPFERLAGLLAALGQVDGTGPARHLYPSAGSLYPVQTYVHVKAGRVEGVPAGAYYYHPAEHRLVLVTPGVELDPAIHLELLNRPIFEQSAFSIFLVADAEAIGPMYGVLAHQLSLLEAGYISQMLMQAATECELGLCPIGSLDFEPVRGDLDLGPSHVLVHSLVGGVANDTPGIVEARPVAGPADGEREDIEI